MPQQPQTQPSPGFSWTHLRQQAEGLAEYLAIPILVFRTKVGLKVLNLPRLYLVSGCMFADALLFQTSPHSLDLMAFAVMILVAGLKQRRKRITDMESGIFVRSDYAGDSTLEGWKLSPWWREKDRIPRILEPIAFCCAGWVFLWFSPFVGKLLILSGCSLRVLEEAMKRHAMEDRIHLMDGIMRAESQSRMVEQFLETRSQNPNANKTSSALPTGLGADVESKIGHQKSSRVPPRSQKNFQRSKPQHKTNKDI